MPSYYTHYYIADKLVAKLPYASRAIVDLYPDAYRLGAFGANLFKAMPRLSSELDYKYVFELFERACAEVFGNGSKCQLAYIIGLTVHYAADKNINPYLYYLYENGVHGYFGSCKDYIGLNKIRTSVDSHIFNKMTPALIKEMTAAPPSEVVSEIAELLERCVLELVGYRIKLSKFESALTDLFMPPPQFYKLEKYDYLNRQKNEWAIIRNGVEMTDMCFEKLLDKTLEETLLLIDGIMRAARSGEPLIREHYKINYLGILSQDKVQ